MNSVRMQTGCLLTASLILGALIALSVHPWPAVAVTGTAGFQPAAVALPSPFAGPSTIRPVVDQGALRRAKCRALWQAVAPYSYSPDLCDYFVLHHECAGIPDQWYYSLVYGYSNFGLTIGRRAPGLCYGPMDVKWPGFARQVGGRTPEDLRDPRLNIRAHVAEMAYYHGRTGRTGFALLATVFYPAAPREYHRWRPTDARFRQILTTWYRKQPLSFPSPERSEGEGSDRLRSAG